MRGSRMARGLKLCMETTPAIAGPQSSGNPRVAHVRRMGLSVHRQLVNLGVKCFPDLPCRPGEVDHHPVGDT